MAFTLELLTNTGTSVDFLDTTTTPARWALMDGGFNISMTRKTRELKPSRPGFFKLIKSYPEYRTATIKASIVAIQTGSYTDDQLRGYILDELNDLERFAMEVEDLQDPLDVSRGELIWKWSGADYTTYFEVYAVDIKLPDGVMSIQTALAHYEDRMVLSDIEITLYIAPTGWGNSINDTPDTELALENPSVGTPTTGGVIVQNPGYQSGFGWAGAYNHSYVETGSFAGNGRPLMKFKITPDTTYYNDWKQLMIGHVVKSNISPYWPERDYYAAMYAPEVAYPDPDLSTVYDVTNTMHGYYVTGTVGLGYTPDPRISFALGGYGSSNPFPGNYYVLACSGTNTQDNDDVMMAVGVLDRATTYYTDGNSDIEERGLFYTTPYAGATVFPLGVVQIPPARMNLFGQSPLDSSIRIGVWLGSNSVTSKTWSLEYLRLIPVTNGMRVWTALTTGTALQSPFYDDMMLNLYYASDGSSAWMPYIPYMDSLRLHPTQGNRLYFMSYGTGGILADRQRAFKVQVFITESFHTLAY